MFYWYQYIIYLIGLLAIFQFIIYKFHLDIFKSATPLDENHYDIGDAIAEAKRRALQEQMEELQNEKRKNLSSNELSPLDNEAMSKLHQRTYKKLTDGEIKMYYNRESISHRRFGTKVLDIHNDRALLMDLFPNKHNAENNRVSDQIRVRLNVQETKIIFIQSKSKKVFENHILDQCNVKQCKFTTSLSDVRGADAIYVENPYYLDSIERDWTSMTKLKLIISFQKESPQSADQLITTSTKMKLNWTASYRTDSVLNTPYGQFTPNLNASGLRKNPKRNYAKGKTKMVAWFVSNCNAANKRRNYVDELEKYINVDVYGLCGTLCPQNNEGEKCFDQLDTDYRFYLAFESSNCKDYVTEKVYTALKHNVIPIVLGAHRKEYSRLLPPNSYIHVDDFQSPKELAKYLLFLTKNDKFYNQYFLWKDTGHFINTKFICRLCVMVHLAPHFPMWYSDANRWWRGGDTCVDPNKDKNGVSYATWKDRKPANENVDLVKYGYMQN